jgi:hypothetical protein
VIDAQRHDDAVLADVDAVDQQRHEVRRVKRGGSASVELRRRFRDEPATHGALFDHARIQRILASHHLKRWQRHVGAILADPRPRMATLRPPRTTSLGAVPARDALRSV